MPLVDEMVLEVPLPELASTLVTGGIPSLSLVLGLAQSSDSLPTPMLAILESMY